MAKQIDFFDGAQSSTTPTIGDIDASNLVQYADDAAYEAANTGAPAEGNIYFNTTLKVVRYYNSVEWVSVLDTDTAQTLTNKTIDGTSATGTNNITIDATDAEYDNTVSGLVADNVQAAIDEVETRLDTAETNITNNTNASSANTSDIADIRTMTGTADGDTNLGIFTGNILTDNSTLKINLQELSDAIEGLGSPLQFQGVWNASTNTPTLTSSTGTQGHFYIVSVAGSTNLDGITDWQVNDWAVFDGTVWRKIDNSELVTSVNGQTGTVSLALDDLSDMFATGPSARDLIRRDTGNTAWEAYNPNNRTNDTTSTGALVTLPTYDAKVVRLSNGGLESISGIGAGYAHQTFILTNVTGVPLTVNNEDATATAANRILTGTSGPVTLDVNASFYLMYDQTSARWRIVGGTGSGEGGLSGIITGNNSTADSTEGDWVTYQDSAQSTPIDGSGGTPNITLARNTTPGEILQGKGSFEIVKGAFDRQGEGVSVDIPVDRWLRGQSAKLSFSYEATADFDFGSAADPVGSPSDISVFLYDVTNSKLLTPSQTGIFGGGVYQSQVQIPSNCENVRVILHIATTNPLAWDFRFDRVQLDLAPAQTIKNASDWFSYTPSFQGFGTVTNIDFEYRIDGPDLLVEGSFTAGTVDGSEAQVTLPNGYLIKSDLNATNVHFGQYLRGVTASDKGGGILVRPGLNHLKFGHSSTFGSTSINALSAAAGNTVTSSGQIVSIEARVPIQGLTSGVSHPAAIGLNAKAIMRATKNGGSVTANNPITNWTTVVEDSLGAFNATTGIYTVKSPGDYFVSGNLALNANHNGVIGFYVNGTLYQTSGSDSTSTNDDGNVLIPNLKYGDTIDMRTNVSGTPSALNTRTNLDIFKIGSEAQPYAPRVAYLKDVKAAGTAGGTFTSGAWQTRTLNTLTGDTSFVSLTANQFTLQPGTYHIEGAAPAFFVQAHIAKIRDITNSQDIPDLIGKSSYSGQTTGDGADSESLITGMLTISSPTTYELQHNCFVTRLTNGFGVGINLGVNNVFSQLKITKVL